MAKNKDEVRMVLKVDLSCPDCCKNIKKILAKILEIRDHSYNYKKNTVRIRAVCCCPEKLRDELYCRGKKVIKSIEIIKPTPPTGRPPPQGNVVIGVPIQAKYFPFELGYGCPVCSGENVICPFCHGHGNSSTRV